MNDLKILKWKYLWLVYNVQIVFGHSKQLWGLAVHPDDELFATAGYDKNISLWKRHALLWSTQVCGYIK